MVIAMTTLLSVTTAMTIAAAILLAGSVLLSVPTLSQAEQDNGVSKGDLLVPRAKIASGRYVVIETRAPGVSVLERVPVRATIGAPRVARLKVPEPKASGS